jgi:hypothetical protein
LLAIVAFGIVYIPSNVAVNELITVMNEWIGAGDMSKQFMTWWNLAIGAWIILPILFLLALGLWAVVRAIERRNETNDQYGG